jgi:hypothetical protein
MITVTLIDKQPNEVMEIVRELRKKGYLQGIDFDFEYHKPVFNDWSGDNVYNRYTVFKFYKESLATWFTLKYQ